VSSELFSRRDVLKVSAAGCAALVVGFTLRARAKDSGRFVPNAWLRISADNQVTILAEKPELGQGSRTYIAMMAGEELDVDWSTIHVEQAPTVPAVYTELHTGSSGGVQTSFYPLRRAGAQARAMLLAAAALEWKAVKSDLRTVEGEVIHVDGRRAKYGQLVGTASLLPLANADETPLKQPKDFRYIGRSMPRVDAPAKVTGSAEFGIDVRLPGMLYAVIVRCPYFGGTLRSFDASRASAVPGVRAVFAVPPLPRHFNTAGGVAVVAESTWAALRGRGALLTTWNKGASAAESSEALQRRAQKRTESPPAFVAVDHGDAVTALARAAKRLDATYESPFQAHATMEPMNTTVHVRRDGIDVWSPTQFANEVQAEIASLAGVSTHRVRVRMTLAGGSFGRRYQWDYAAEAWQVARRLSAPVQLLWTREDDLQHDFYRPYNCQSLSAGLDAQGKLTAWHNRLVTTPIAASNLYNGYIESPETLADPATVAALEWYGADVAPYDVADCRVDYAPVDSVVPRSWWRSVASSYTTFARESFLDEMAGAAQRDPLQFRLDLLQSDASPARRLRKVLMLAAEKAHWDRSSLGKYWGRGIACRSGGAACAQVADVFVDTDGQVQVRRVVTAVDCGIAVNPDGVRAMLEGAINFALTATLTGEITVKEGRVEQGNFHDYRVLRMSQAPEIDVHILPSVEEPDGVGELGAMVIAPAVVNAIHAATGVRIRRLPVDPQLLAHA
jgi:isoquinoline 1-oxidoreductase beta subunit